MNRKKIGVGFGVMMVRDGKVLLGKRHSDQTKASSALDGEGTWTMPGGKLQYGETFEEGVKREVGEETGIIVREATVIGINNDIGTHAHFVTLGFLSTDFEGEPRVLEPNEIIEWNWFELDNLPSPLYFPSAKVIENYQQKRFYIQPKKAGKPSPL